MKVALYARVSDRDSDQNPDNQLIPLRDYARARGWQVSAEYVDRARAKDLAARLQWRRLLDDAARRRFGVVLVWKLDRAFRSVKMLHDTLCVWEPLGISFTSLREQIDTTSAAGRLMMNLLAALAEFELDLISERVRAGMDRARREGKHLGRPRAIDRHGMRPKVARAAAAIAAGASLRAAAAAECIPATTLRRLLKEFAA